jgi:hypothetical protein
MGKGIAGMVSGQWAVRRGVARPPTSDFCLLTHPS